MNALVDSATATPPQPLPCSGVVVHLRCEPTPDESSPVPPLEIGSGVFGLSPDSDGTPQLVPAAEMGAGVAVEMVLHEKRCRLLMVALGPGKVFLNDQVAPTAVLLAENDQIRLAEGRTWEVGFFCDPYVGEAPADLIGTPCPVCRSPFRAGDRLYRCPICGRGLHLEEGDAQEALQCALVSGICPSCRHPVRLESGYLSMIRILEEEG